MLGCGSATEEAFRVESLHGDAFLISLWATWVFGEYGIIAALSLIRIVYSLLTDSPSDEESTCA